MNGLNHVDSVARRLIADLLAGFSVPQSFAQGSVAAPSIYMATNSETGWYQIAANNWGFSVSGSKYLDISSSGVSVGAAAAGGVNDIFTFKSVAGLNTGHLYTGPGGTVGIFDTASGGGNGFGAIKATNIAYVQCGGVVIGNFSSAGCAVTGALSATSTIKTGGYTVATLPAGAVGARAYVTDAAAPTFLAPLAGGGAVKCPAFYNGSAWVAG